MALARIAARRSAALLPKALAASREVMVAAILPQRWESSTTATTPATPSEPGNLATSSELFANDHVFDENAHAKKHFDALQNKKQMEPPTTTTFLFEDYDATSAFDENEVMEKASRLAEAAAAKNQPKK